MSNGKTATAAAPLATPALPQTVTIADTTANPAPLGLLCFGLTTTLLSIHNAGLYPLDAMIVSMALFYGGTAQIFAGVFEWKKKNTFATTAFISYGFFWLTLCGIIMLPKMGLAAAPDKTSMACFLAVWGLMSFVLFIGTFRLNRALQVTFFLLVVLFALLVAGDIPPGNPQITKIAGYEGVLTGLAAMYTGLAQVLNELYGRVVMPLGPYQPKPLAK
jgi:succinate-acetate transporter protein